MHPLLEEKILEEKEISMKRNTEKACYDIWLDRCTHSTIIIFLSNISESFRVFVQSVFC